MAANNPADNWGPGGEQDQVQQGVDTANQFGSRVGNKALERATAGARRRAVGAGLRAGDVFAEKTAGTAVGKAATAAAGKVGGKLTGTAVGAAIGEAATPIGAVIGAAVVWVFDKTIGWVNRHKAETVALLAGGAIGGIATASVPGIVLGIAATGLIVGNITYWLASLMPAVITTLVVLIGIPLFIAFSIHTINTGAWVVPPWNYRTGPQPTVDSIYIDVDKSPEPYRVETAPASFTYTITITAERATLTNLSYQYDCFAFGEDGRQSCPTEPDVVALATEQCGESIAPQNPCTFSYTVDYAENYQDTIVQDVFHVRADVEGISGEESAGIAAIIIGDPPSDCPTSSWPIIPPPGSTFYVTRGPYSIDTHASVEAIDIGTNQTEGHPVQATHSGIVVRSQLASDGFGNVIEISSICQTPDGEIVPFLSRYGHLSTRSVGVGEEVTAFTPIGLSGNTGNSTGPHLHYEFRIGTNTPGSPAGPYPNYPPTMDRPYIPEDAHGCGNSCNIPVR